MKNAPEIKEGDRIRVVLEGLVESANVRSFRIGSGSAQNVVMRAAEHVVSVEILPRPHKVGDVIDGSKAHRDLPAGAVVRDSMGIHGVKTVEGHWIFADGPDAKANPACRSTLVALPE